MGIVINEIKKIFNTKMVILLIIINIIMYFLLIEFDIKHFPNGRPAGDNYRIAVQMQKDYGTNMDEEEFENFKSIYNEKLKEADKYIQGDKEFRELGIKNYKEFIEKKEENLYKDKESESKLDKLYSRIMFKEMVDLFWEIPQREDIIKRYENKDKFMFMNYRNLTKQQETRIKEILNNKSDTSVFHEVIIENYNFLIFHVSLAILISTIFMISPVYLRDNKNNINFLQYTSKKGRKIFKSKAIAAIISSFIITTIQFICFFALYSQNKVGMFFHSNINSLLNFRHSWYDITFIQYIAITVAAVYILVLAFTMMSILVSSTAHNYIALVGVQLPIALLIFKVFLRTAVTDLVDIRFKEGIVPLCYAVVVILLIALIIKRWRRERVADI
ncbi:hypothetical protein [Clostridium sp. OS1-26]|uniref:hypothetical protein n=1 Tax=Clostridium sp. OS1-26 TaxID=3070681 RepID=UPI0027DFE65E|nr:hypothetical protein [Clostridium sp. OS1-26]WML33272.1 hypothetical protein RCG18_18220 [Clostridium sp. OS1-26]